MLPAAILWAWPPHTGRVVYLAGEDPPPALVRRIHAIGQHLGHAARQAIAENLALEPIMGKRLNVMDEAHLPRHRVQRRGEADRAGHPEPHPRPR